MIWIDLQWCFYAQCLTHSPQKQLRRQFPDWCDILHILEQRGNWLNFHSWLRRCAEGWGYLKWMNWLGIWYWFWHNWCQYFCSKLKQLKDWLFVHSWTQIPWLNSWCNDRQGLMSFCQHISLLRGIGQFRYWCHQGYNRFIGWYWCIRTRW